MAAPQFLETAPGRRIAYHQVPGDGPGVVFLGGFKSDMEGTKATYLDAWARRVGRAFLRFDYSGHGLSSGDFLDGTIGDWASDALAVIGTLTEGPQVLAGSSMGGWIALLVARRLPARVAALVGIAAAPDFTEDSMWDSFDTARRTALERDGRIEWQSDYSGAPCIITRRLIEDGRTRLVLRDPLPLPFPVRLLHGTDDRDVDISVALRLMDRAESPDMRLTFVKGADHRFSDDDCLAMIEGAIAEVTARVAS
ncbi:MAG: alpha/beta hydrolase [Rhodobacteraceae bacterium]|nr:alpha/beta hydrolase [Paracoccaceae bacterium]